MKKLLALASLLFMFCVADAYALDNGLAKTPPMGWNSWNKFGCNVNEKLIKEMGHWNDPDMLDPLGLQGRRVW